MVEIIKSLSDISSNYDVVLCDIWGCIHNGRTAFPNALKALSGFRRSGGTVMLITNAPRPKQAVKDQLEKLGISDSFYDDITTSGDAAQLSMISGSVGFKVYHIGPEKDSSFFTDLPKTLHIKTPVERVTFEEANGIVCTGLFDDMIETPHDYLEILNKSVNRSLKLLCVNPDIFVDFGEKRLWCAGGLAQAFSAVGGISIYCGKPHRAIYELAYANLDNLVTYSKRRILCIGDGIHTDVLGGEQEQLDTLFVCAGLSKDEISIDNESHSPDKYQLQNFILKNGVTPTAAIGFLT